MSSLLPELTRIAAFSEGDSGGNPAGVWIGPQLPAAETMQQMAAEIGFSETAFAMPLQEGATDEWRVRYFSPEAEVPFCGHATIAMTVGLARRFGAGEYRLHLNLSTLTVSAQQQDGQWQATLLSPPCFSQPEDPVAIEQALALLGYGPEDLDPRIPVARIHAGADHLVLALNSRQALAAMQYHLLHGRTLMRQHGWVTLLLVFAENHQRFHTRNPFAYGGVYEDPATGAATAALAGYLRDLDWPHQGEITIVQGEDMGMRSLISAEIDPVPGDPIRLSGQARVMAH
ncbi:PhzF family phenazine biosynthesis protein [Tatumella saanichensis]|uniref:PhzF family phenazine biosynthesis protein n=1 Tax=Tatumella saanichensis TaxID=480813 RepID=UPI0004A4D953|nr:PhzF family phenazine biosynthesis protein [Tatumella saanichensis]